MGSKSGYLVCAAKWENRQPQASAFPFASVYGPFGAHRSATVRAMVPRLAVRTPQPTHLSNPSSPPISAPSQILAALHDADAPFYSSPKPPCPLVPSLPLVLLALLTFLPSFGQAYLLHPHLFC